MKIITFKHGTEKYANRVFNTYFYISSGDGLGEMKLSDHPTYHPHEQIICGLNGCFGTWEVGHVSLEEGIRIHGYTSRKILAYDANSEVDLYHFIRKAVIKVGSKKTRNFGHNYWGYNGGKKFNVLLSGSFDVIKDDMKRWKLSTPLDKLPF